MNTNSNINLPQFFSFLQQKGEKDKNINIKAIKEALLSEFNLPEVLPKEETDAYSQKWHQIFEYNTQRIQQIFLHLGLSKEQVEGILQEYGKNVHQYLWK